MACFFQVLRAFHHIFHFVLGSSLTAAKLRAAIWQSIFTHNMRRYRQFLFDRLSDVPTLISGPSGTGKELVARAIGLSRFIPFDPEKKCFVANFVKEFGALNLSSLSPTLIESELFGHQRGSFTGATEHRTGLLRDDSAELAKIQPRPSPPPSWRHQRGSASARASAASRPQRTSISSN